MSGTSDQVRVLRDLADALDRQAQAHHHPDIPAPSGRGEILPLATAESYHCNKTLLAAIEREIRLSWEELRTRALARLDASVEQLSAQVREHLDPETRGTREA